MSGRALPLVALLATGCAARLRPDSAVACRMVRDSSLARATVRDLVDLSLGTPVQGQAESAYAQQISAGVLGGLAAASMLAGLVLGFAVDPIAQPGARTAALSLGGAAIGMVALTITLGYTTPWTAGKARERLHAWGERCSDGSPYSSPSQ